MAVARGRYVWARAISGLKTRPLYGVEGGVAAKQGFRYYYFYSDAIGTKVSVRYRRSGRLSGVVVKRGFTVYIYSYILCGNHVTVM